MKILAGDVSGTGNVALFDDELRCLIAIVRRPLCRPRPDR
jgi:hypothetical protein